MSQNSTPLPIVLVPVGTDEAALDACLAALDASTPADTRVWLADDAQAGPRGLAIIQRWLEHTRLDAAHTRRTAAIGEARHLDEALRACADADVAVLASNVRPAPGWLQQLQRCLQSDPSIVSATPWSNAGEAASWPRLDEVLPLALPLPLLAEACAQLAPSRPELPAAISHAVLLRGRARQQAGGLDATSFRSWYAALIDLSLRMAGFGGRNVLCENAFVARACEGMPWEGDMDALAARWPSWHAQIAQTLMQDALHPLREALQQRVDTLLQRPPQADLFAGAQ